MSTARFTGRRVLVTGGNSGIGRAAALAFAAEGAHVAIAARDTTRSSAVVDQIESSGGRAVSYRCDVTDPASAEAAVSACLSDLGGLDVLFNNAGIIVREKAAHETSVEEWDRTFAVNTRGVFLMSKFAVVAMMAQGGGAIVNNASYFGLVGGRGVAAYSASKGAVVLLTKAMALDHAADGVRVNCVCPGSVETPMLHAEMDEIGDSETVRRSFEEKHPLGRIATPDEIAQAVLYLASDDAAFITGVALPVDGGITAG